MNNRPLLEIRNMSAGYVKGDNVLNGINLDIYAQEIVAIVGQNGSGKSTLAKTIMKITPNIEGSVKLLGKELMQVEYSTKDIFNSGIGFFIQEGVVFENMTVGENLLFSGRMLDRKKIAETINYLKNYFELLCDNKRLHMKATYLSGGEKHQLALAMVIMRKPKLLVLDEPSAGLSPINRKSMFTNILKLKTEFKISILLIEQNIIEALKIADRVASMKLGNLQEIDKEVNPFDIDRILWK